LFEVRGQEAFDRGLEQRARKDRAADTVDVRAERDRGQGERRARNGADFVGPAQRNERADLGVDCEPRFARGNRSLTRTDPISTERPRSRRPSQPSAHSVEPPPISTTAIRRPSRGAP
jgi:hypothetical protein